MGELEPGKERNASEEEKKGTLIQYRHLETAFPLNLLQRSIELGKHHRKISYPDCHFL